MLVSQNLLAVDSLMLALGHGNTIEIVSTGTYSTVHGGSTTQSVR